ncbi:MAG: hypothetical protein ACK521_05240 [bacterium]
MQQKREEVIQFRNDLMRRFSNLKRKKESQTEPGKKKQAEQT